jgi:hypothetical protein
VWYQSPGPRKKEKDRGNSEFADFCLQLLVNLLSGTSTGKCSLFLGAGGGEQVYLLRYTQPKE